MHGNITYPKHFSKEAVDLIARLLHPKPTRRIGVLKGGATLIKRHAWFRGFDWKALEQGTMKAPIVPTVKSDVDLTNFEEYEHEGEGDVTPEYVDDGSGWDDDF